MPINVAVAGAGGRMGREVLSALAAGQPELILTLAFEHAGNPAVGAAVEHAGISVQTDQALETAAVDVLIDFTAPSATLKFADICRRRQIAMVIGSTGFSEAQLQQLKCAGEDIALLLAQNMSMGVNALYRIAAHAAACLKAGRLGGGYDIEVSEEHHRHKKDAPSGTALRLGQALAQATGGDFNTDAVFTRCGADALRGEHDIGFSVVRGGDIVGTHRVLFAGRGEQVEIIHRSISRANYAAGAVQAARYIARAEPGFYDDIAAVLQQRDEIK